MASIIDLLNSLTTSDIIDLINVISSFFLGLVGIAISLFALRQSRIAIKQNNQMLEDSSRPYITLYLDSITICEQQSYFVLKNFGNSPACITDFEYDPLLKVTSQEHKSLQEQFDFVKGLILAPGQSKLLIYDVTRLPIDTINFYIKYVNNGSVYQERISMNVKHYIHIPVDRPDSEVQKGDERLVNTLREMLERRL